ncbi:MAG: hypothetical protein ACP5UA_08470 [Candidatus Hydrogenedens sp.]
MSSNRKKIVFVIFILLFVPIYLYGQQDKPENNSKAETPPSATLEKEEGNQPAPESEIVLPGDIIYFKSGKKMSGIQVLRELPDKIEVQVSENAEPLLLPRRLIKSIEYDNIDPLKNKIQKDILSSQKQDENVIPGEELSKEFNQKMRTPLSDSVISYKDEGLLKILGELTQKVGVTLEIDESIRTIPPEERKKSFDIPAGTSLYKFLQTDFSMACPNIQITYKYDKIFISLKSPGTNSNNSQ